MSGFLVAFLFFNLQTAYANVIFDEVIGNDFNTTTRINAIGNEVYAKTGVNVALAVGGSLTSMQQLLDKQKELKEPYVLLAISKKEHKVEIVGTKDVFAFFDKQKVLSPLASEGTILPILASGKKENIDTNIRAAALNGYSDIAEQIAKYFNISLNSSIGNANKDTLNILRIVIYGFIFVAILFYAQRRLKRRRKNA